MFKINRIVIASSLASGEALSHTGHNAPVLHLHGWEYALLAAAVAAIAVRWYRARK